MIAFVSIKVGTTLQRLKDGFMGSLAVVETSGIILASSSGIILEPVSTSSDPFLEEASSSLVLEAEVGSRKQPTTVLILHVSVDPC